MSKRSKPEGKMIDRQKGHQTRRARGGKEAEAKVEKHLRSVTLISFAEGVYCKKGMPAGYCSISL